MWYSGHGDAIFNIDNCNQHLADNESATGSVASSFSSVTNNEDEDDSNDECRGLVFSSVANLVHLCGEDMGSNPARTVSDL